MTGMLLPCILQCDSPKARDSQVQHGSGWSSARQPTHLWSHLALVQACKSCTSTCAGRVTGSRFIGLAQRTPAGPHP